MFIHIANKFIIIMQFCTAINCVTFPKPLTNGFNCKFPVQSVFTHGNKTLMSDGNGFSPMKAVSDLLMQLGNHETLLYTYACTKNDLIFFDLFVRLNFVLDAFLKLWLLDFDYTVLLFSSAKLQPIRFKV